MTEPDTRRTVGRWIGIPVALAMLSATDGRPAEASDGDEKPAVLTIPDTGLTEREQVLHLLNRIGFGPRPGDIEHVAEHGLPEFIEQQLDPELVPDPGMNRRLAGLGTLEMSTHELLVAYPPPQLLRAVEQRLSTRMGMDSDAAGNLFPELEQRRRRQKDQEQMSASGKRGKAGESLARALDSPNRIVFELSQAKILRAVHSERQLQEVMTDFWFNHFNVYIGKGADRWWTTSYEYEAIRPHALGSFRDLLGATARHPAMLFYLDNWLSAAPDVDVGGRQLQGIYARELEELELTPNGVVVDILQDRGLDTTELERTIQRQQSMARHGMQGNTDALGGSGPRRGGLNENYARELLELHTLGVDGGYTQEDIIEVARCFTGWTLLPPQHGWGFVYVDELHDGKTKHVLGKKIKKGGMEDGEAVLDLLARHPSTARFISFKLAQRFVSDDPPDSLVESMSKTFLKTDGDIPSVLRTMLGSEEFWSPEAVGAKVKTPFEFVISALRATDAELAGLPGEKGGEPPGALYMLRALGQPPYSAQPPTGYKSTADAWVSTGALLARMKVALGLVTGRVPGADIEIPEELPDAESIRELLGSTGVWLVGHEPSESEIDAMARQLETAGVWSRRDSSRGVERVAMGWILASADFQRR